MQKSGFDLVKCLNKKYRFLFFWTQKDLNPVITDWLAIQRNYQRKKYYKRQLKAFF